MFPLLSLIQRGAQDFKPLFKILKKTIIIQRFWKDYKKQKIKKFTAITLIAKKRQKLELLLHNNNHQINKCFSPQRNKLLIDTIDIKYNIQHLRKVEVGYINQQYQPNIPIVQTKIILMYVDIAYNTHKVRYLFTTYSNNFG